MEEHHALCRDLYCIIHIVVLERAGCMGSDDLLVSRDMDRDQYAGMVYQENLVKREKVSLSRFELEISAV